MDKFLICLRPDLKEILDEFSTGYRTPRNRIITISLIEYLLKRGVITSSQADDFFIRTRKTKTTNENTPTA